VSSPESTSVEVLFEQGAVFVLNKPGGLLTQAPPGIDNLEWRFRNFIKGRLQSPGHLYVGLPHRLDRPVSGAIIFVRNIRAAQRISAQLEQRTVKKIYWAIVEGRIPEKEGTWVDWMRKIPDEAKSEIVPHDHPEAKNAILHYQLVEQFENLSWVEIELETGRTHQIRLQFSARGFPIVGDTIYDAKSSFGQEFVDQRKQWIALHARRLTFEHPMEHVPVDVLAPIHAPWNRFANTFPSLFQPNSQ
jgi:23S rRNA pseudouridine1911/1915/1917 synthase